MITGSMTFVNKSEKKLHQSENSCNTLQELLNQSRKEHQQSEKKCQELQEENESLQVKLENSLLKPAATKLTKKSAAYKDTI